MKATNSHWLPWLLFLAAGDPIQVADPNRTYLASIQLDGGTDDNISVEVNSKGLLQSADATSTDESPAIAVKIAQTVGEIVKAVTVAKGAQVPPPVYADDEKQRRIACKALLRPFTVKWNLDLSSALTPGAVLDTSIAVSPEHQEQLNRAILTAMVNPSTVPNGPVTIGDFVTILITPSGENELNPPNIIPGQAAQVSPGLRFRAPRASTCQAS